MLTIGTDTPHVRVRFVPWGICGCPMDWGSPDGKTRGWWVSLTVQSFFGEIKVVTVTGGGEGYSLRAAEEHAQILALSELRRMDPSDLSVQQLAIRADALAALVVRVEGVDSDG